MSCPFGVDNEFAERYLCGELEPGAEGEFEVHLLECPVCQNSLDSLIDIRAALAEIASATRAVTVVLLPAASLETVNPLWQDPRSELFGEYVNTGQTRKRLGFRGMGALQMPRWAWVCAAAIMLAVGVSVTFQLRHWTKSEVSRNGPRLNAPTSGAQGSMPPQAPSDESFSAGIRKNSNTSGLRSASKEPMVKPEHGAQGESPTQHPKPEPTSENATTAKLEEGIRNDSNVTPSEQSTSPENPARGDPTHETVVTSSKELLARLGEVQLPPYTFAGNVRSPAQSDIESNHAVGTPLGFTKRTGVARNLFRNAMLAYVDKRYADAAALLQDTVKLRPIDWEANFFLGICRLMLSNPLDAIPPLQVVADNRDTSIAQQGHFYLAKAYLQIEDLPSADRELKAASALPGHLQQQAQSLLNDFNSLTAPNKKSREPLPSTPR